MAGMVGMVEVFEVSKKRKMVSAAAFIYLDLVLDLVIFLLRAILSVSLYPRDA